MRRAALALAVLAAAAAAPAPAADAPPDGRVGPATGLYTNGRLVQPVGRQTTLGNFPTGGALSPDGRFYWAVDAGHGINDVKVLDVASGKITQTLPIPGGFVGVAFAPDGRRAYVSGEPKGCCNKTEGMKGEKGDVIHVFTVDPATGRATESDPIAIPPSSGGSGRQNQLPPAPNGNAYPQGLDVSADGKTLVVALGNADRVAIVDTASGSVKLADVGAYPYSVAIDPRHPRAYVTNEYDGTVSVLDLPGGKLVQTVPVGGPAGDKGAHPEGLVVDPGRERLYVAVTNRDLIAIVDTQKLQTLDYVDVGREQGVGTAPVDVAIAPDGQTLYSANAGEDAVAAIALADRPATSQPVVKSVFQVRGAGSIARYRKRLAVERQRLRRAHGSRAARARYQRAARKLRSRYLIGAAVRACSGPSRAQDAAYGRAVLRAIARYARDRKQGRGDRRRLVAAKRRYLSALARAAGALPSVERCPAAGFLPNAKGNTVLGRLPTASYPTDVAVTPDGKRLIWLAARGYGAGPNPEYGQAFADSNAAPYGSYVPQKLIGRAGVLSLPSDRAVSKLTPKVEAQLTPTNFKRPPPNTPLVGPGGGPSDKIKYVFYVVRENRTYDQVFGSEPRGDGDPALQLFDDNGVPRPTGGVTPNAHRLARTFPLLDHVYANSEVSIDGHLITSGAYATDYSVKGLHPSYSGRGKGNDVGIFPVSFPPNGFVFDQAVRQQITFRAYGEVGAGNQPFGDDGRATFGQVIANTDYAYPTNLQIGCVGSGPNLARCTQDSGAVGTTGTKIGLGSRVDSFRNELAQQIATGTVPRFNYLILPNDHTDGARAGDYTPKAMVADNDLALGQMVEVISKSPIWKESAIFVVEDDTQDGADHVDAHRMPAFVISPWAKRGAVIGTRYDQYSFLRTAMMIVGLRPVALNDALATPLYDAFVSGDEQPDVEGTRYSAVQPEQPLDEVNPQSGSAARLSAALPWDDLDRVPQAVSDRVLWRSVFGDRAEPPAPGPNASALEHTRAMGALRVYRRGGDVRRWLRALPEKEGNELEKRLAERARRQLGRSAAGG